jgi:hypothetical protein
VVGRMLLWISSVAYVASLWLWALDVSVPLIRLAGGHRVELNQERDARQQETHDVAGEGIERMVGERT